MSDKFFDLSSDKYGIKAIIHSIIGIAIYAISEFLSSFVVDQFWILTKFEITELLIISRGILSLAIFIPSIILYSEKALRLNREIFRIKKKNISITCIIISILLPAIIVAIYFLFFSGEIYYQKKEKLLISIVSIVKVAFCAGIAEELLFRGFIMSLLEKKWNYRYAIILPSILFALLHAVKGMNIADIIMLLLAGSLVGIMFSVITYKTKNLINAIIVHIMWNMMIVGIFNITSGESRRALIEYDLNTSSIFITGGAQGIESSLISIVGYSIVIAIIILESKKHKFT